MGAKRTANKKLLVRIQSSLSAVCDEKLRKKIRLYLASLFVLFGLIVVLSVGVENTVAVIASLLCVYSIYLNFNLDEFSKKTYFGPLKIKSAVKEDYEYLSFLTTYIIPLACLDFEKPRYYVVLVILLVIIGVIYIRTGQYYGNPTLAFFGYRLYRVEIDSDEYPGEFVLISRGFLRVNMEINAIKIDDNIWFAEEAEV